MIDYFGVLKQLGEAMELYGSFDEFDQADIESALIDINIEIAKLPQKHSELWDIFKTIPNKRDEEAYERLLSEEDDRAKFYERFSAFNRVLSIALSVTKTLSGVGNNSDKDVEQRRQTGKQKTSRNRRNSFARSRPRNASPLQIPGI